VEVDLPPAATGTRQGEVDGGVGHRRCKARRSVGGMVYERRQVIFFPVANRFSLRDMTAG
jgi:hypothetical protein